MDILCADSAVFNTTLAKWDIFHMFKSIAKQALCININKFIECQNKRDLLSQE